MHEIHLRGTFKKFVDIGPGYTLVYKKRATFIF